MTTYSGKDYLLWLVERGRQWTGSAHTAGFWSSTCIMRYGRVPLPEEMSMQELEETLLNVGDADVPDVRGHASRSEYGGAITELIHSLINRSEARWRPIHTHVSPPL